MSQFADIYYRRVITEEIIQLIHGMNLPLNIDAEVARACEDAGRAALDTFKKALGLE